MPAWGWCPSTPAFTALSAASLVSWCSQRRLRVFEGPGGVLPWRASCRQRCASTGGGGGGGGPGRGRGPGGGGGAARRPGRGGGGGGGAPPPGPVQRAVARGAWRCRATGVRRTVVAAAHGCCPGGMLTRLACTHRGSCGGVEAGGPVQRAVEASRPWPLGQQRHLGRRTLLVPLHAGGTRRAPSARRRLGRVSVSEIHLGLDPRVQ
jgi:hypothetical protein